MTTAVSLSDLLHKIRQSTGTSHILVPRETIGDAVTVLRAQCEEIDTLRQCLALAAKHPGSYEGHLLLQAAVRLEQQEQTISTLHAEKARLIAKVNELERAGRSEVAA